MAIDPGLTRLVGRPGLTVRTVLEADEPELRGRERIGDREQEHRLAEADRGRPVLRAPAMQRREEIDRVDARGYELGSGRSVGFVCAAEREPVGRRAAMVVDAIGIGARFEQAGDELMVVALHRDVERSRAGERGRVRIGARVQQVLDHRAVAAHGCGPQR